MARLRLDLRPVFRAIAARLQDENADRLLRSQGVRDEELAPNKTPPESVTGRKRVRVFGVRVALKELARLGVKTGEMLRDLTRRGNIKVGRLGFKIKPSAATRVRWVVFNKGREERQPARPVGGATAQALVMAANEVARATREQLVLALRDRERPR